MKRNWLTPLLVSLCFLPACTPSGTPAPDDGILHGPGFTLQIPSTFATPLADGEWSPPSFASFAKGFWNDDQSRVIIAGVVTPSFFSTSTTPQQTNNFHISGAMMTQSGDFLLTIHMVNTNGEGETLGAYGLLADGNLLSVEIDGPEMTPADQTLALSLFSSVDLQNTDGWAFETLNRPAMEAATLRVKASDNTLILSDKSAWGMRYDALPNDYQEVAQWAIGDKLISQTYRDNRYAFEDTHDLVHVGRWVPVKVEYYGQASEVTITQIVDYDTLAFSDGTTGDLFYGVPADWKAGDTVFKVAPDLGLKRVIHGSTGLARNMF
jgi:hypothetical protein